MYTGDVNDDEGRQKVRPLVVRNQALHLGSSPSLNCTFMMMNMM